MAGNSVSRKIFGAPVIWAALLTPGLCGFMTQARALSPLPNSAIKKIVSGKYTVEADNGWVIFQAVGGTAGTSLRFFNQHADGSYTATGAAKLKIANNTQAAARFSTPHGVVFAPCPVVKGTKCQAQDSGPACCRLFGQAIFSVPPRRSAAG